MKITLEGYVNKLKNELHKEGFSELEIDEKIIKYLKTINDVLIYIKYILYDISKKFIHNYLYNNNISLLESNEHLTILSELEEYYLTSKDYKDRFEVINNLINKHISSEISKTEYDNFEINMLNNEIINIKGSVKSNLMLGNISYKDITRKNKKVVGKSITDMREKYDPKYGLGSVQAEHMNLSTTNVLGDTDFHVLISLRQHITFNLELAKNIFTDLKNCVELKGTFHGFNSLAQLYIVKLLSDVNNKKLFTTFKAIGTESISKLIKLQFCNFDGVINDKILKHFFEYFNSCESKTSIDKTLFNELKELNEKSQYILINDMIFYNIVRFIKFHIDKDENFTDENKYNLFEKIMSQLWPYSYEKIDEEDFEENKFNKIKVGSEYYILHPDSKIKRENKFYSINKLIESINLIIKDFATEYFKKLNIKNKGGINKYLIKNKEDSIDKMKLNKIFQTYG